MGGSHVLHTVYFKLLCVYRYETSNKQVTGHDDGSLIRSGVQFKTRTYFCTFTGRVFLAYVCGWIWSGRPEGETEGAAVVSLSMSISTYQSKFTC